MKTVISPSLEIEPFLAKLTRVPFAIVYRTTHFPIALFAVMTKLWAILTGMAAVVAATLTISNPLPGCAVGLT